jgi:hypothetical protein
MDADTHNHSAETRDTQPFRDGVATLEICSCGAARLVKARETGEWQEPAGEA